MENKEIMARNTDIVTDMQNASASIFTSWDVNDDVSRTVLFNAISGADGETIKSMVGKPIMMVDVVISNVEVLNPNGTRDVVPRTTIIDQDGVMYSATSQGVYNSLKKMNAIFGTLHFDPPRAVTPMAIKTKSGETISLKL